MKYLDEKELKEEIYHYHSTNSLGINDTVEFSYKLIGEWDSSKSPRKPSHPYDMNSKEALAYAEKLREYEEDLVAYKDLLDLYEKQEELMLNIINEIIKEDSGLNSLVFNEKIKGKIWDYAYQKGHSSGLGEVYNELCDLVDIFVEK